MRAEFTAGPWYASEPFAGFGAIKQTSTDALIFGLAAGGLDEKQSDDVCEANAYLIAAAPELYEALERLHQAYYAAHITQGVDPTESVALAVSHAALAKARGEQVPA